MCTLKEKETRVEIPEVTIRVLMSQGRQSGEGKVSAPQGVWKRSFWEGQPTASCREQKYPSEPAEGHCWVLPSATQLQTAAYLSLTCVSAPGGQGPWLMVPVPSVPSIRPGTQEVPGCESHLAAIFGRLHFAHLVG